MLEEVGSLIPFGFFAPADSLVRVGSLVPVGSLIFFLISVADTWEPLLDMTDMICDTWKST